MTKDPATSDAVTSDAVTSDAVTSDAVTKEAATKDTEPRLRGGWRRWGAAFSLRTNVVRCVTLAAILPTPLWFLLAVLEDDGPAWRAVYHAQSDFSGAQVLVAERRLSRFWDPQDRRVPGAFNVRRFSAVFDTCLTLREPRAIPFQLVVNGSGRLSIDGLERLRAGKSQEREVRGEVLELPAGTHYLRVEFAAEGWPTIAVNASLDGRAPVAVPPEEDVAGVTWFRPRPGAEPCPP
ncbi:MAG: hypothetical protein RL685_5305 [Pseudomonadota bacterium]